jgi:hypothetical protein
LQHVTRAPATPRDCESSLVGIAVWRVNTDSHPDCRAAWRRLSG